jgi:beta-alanine degradation protein BauB
VKALSQVQVDNDEVIVTAWWFKPGEETGHHVHGHPYVVVPLTDGTLRIGDHDVQLRAGQAYARPAGIAHNVSNRSENDVRFIEVEIKSTPAQAAG